MSIGNKIKIEQGRDQRPKASDFPSCTGEQCYFVFPVDTNTFFKFMK